MHSGRYVFSQVVDFVPRYEFDRIVAKYNGKYHARELTCYNQFLHLLFGQLTGCSSLREICLCLEAYFVTRAKDNMRYEVEERNYNIDESYGLLGDCTVKLTEVKTAKLYPKPLSPVLKRSFKTIMSMNRSCLINNRDIISHQ